MYVRCLQQGDYPPDGDAIKTANLLFSYNSEGWLLTCYESRDHVHLTSQWWGQKTHCWCISKPFIQDQLKHTPMEFLNSQPSFWPSKWWIFSNKSHPLSNTLKSRPTQTCIHAPWLSHLCQTRQQKSCGRKQHTTNKKQTYLIRVSKDVSSRTPIQFSIRDYFDVATAT